MSTLTSADFGELKRPTTRVHAPPGGGSNWSWGDDTPAQPAARGRQQRQAQQDVQMSPPTKPAAAAVEPPPAPLAAAPVAAATAAVPAGGLRIALVKTAVDAEIVDQMLQNCWDKLKQNGELSVETFTVPSLDELPYAANKLTQYGGFDGVICFGFLNTVDPLFATLSSALAQSFIDISVRNVKPVIRAVFTGEPRVASVKVKGGLGSEYAASIDSLIRLGGFVGPIPHFAEGKQAQRPFSVSHGNVLPPRLLGASRGVLSTLDSLRNSMYQNGATGIAGIGRKFRIIDDDGNRQLSLSEFTKAIHEHALDLTPAEIEELFRFIDADNSGGINFDEFLLAIRGELNERRTQMVLAAFKVLDADSNGVIELSDIQQKYGADSHPDVLSGYKTSAQVLREFLDTFDGGEKDGKVYPNEFIRYYANVSASIDDDDYFELMIRNAWHISGGEGWCENTTCRRVLVTHADGRQTVEEVKNDIGISANNVEAIRANLQAQGITDTQGIDTQGGYVEVKGDPNKRGPEPFQPKYPKKKHTGAGESSIVFG
ncbi:hypothetical protein Poli38472_007623 [Pythium oligandrum]|uniref:EF-hand domain-containing protein n=1 Tax=Pythium oligandrum TaxID=41045 RepID=A0A8K1FM79_PYTOL|nr:hypothetical protein Poli38472_007623 [Pythium oligandrum]|eukprot:TMW67951.1 hypothetical protein Poli38472_007623 [Pythium oligandrum]